MTSFVRAPKVGYRIGVTLVAGDLPIKPKRFLIFIGESYYPSGGWSDFLGSADTLDDAKAALEANKRDWDQIIDLDTGQEV